MILHQVAKQIKSIYPLYDDSFSDTNSIIDYGFIRNQLTFKTKLPNNLEVNDFVVISGVRVMFPIIKNLYNPETGILTIQLESNHQIFSNENKLLVMGYDSVDFNGEFDILTVDENHIFTLQLPKHLQIDLPDTSVKHVVKELSYYVNDYHKVSMINTEIENSFTILYELIPNTHLDLTNAVIKTSRVTATADIDFTLKNKRDSNNLSWLYVSIDGVDVDASNMLSNNQINLTYYVNVYAEYPIKTENLGVEATDLMLNQIYSAINKSILYNWQPTINIWQDGILTPNNAQSLTVGSISKYGIFTSNRIVYQFGYKFASILNNSGGFTLEKERRLRKISGVVNGKLTFVDRF